MRIHVFGAAQEVGRSAIGVECKRHSLLLDAGIKLGEKLGLPSQQLFSFLDKKRSHIFISHAHLDHCGFLPFMSDRKERIFTTKPSFDLFKVLLADFLRVQKMRGEQYFTVNDINKVLKRVEHVEYGVKRGVPSLTLYNAGHILGSAMVRFRCGNKLVLYTGDFSTRNSKILDAAPTGMRADVVITESTYATERLPSVKDETKRLVNIVNEVISKGGSILIPSFAVGRGQEVLVILHELMKNKRIPRVPIFVDGMIKKALRIYRQNLWYASERMKKLILMSLDDPFRSEFFHVPRSLDRKEVFKQPSIIVSTSGMLVGGPALFYLKRLANNPNNALVFVGYQAKGTPGRALLEGKRKVVVGEEEIEVAMRVERVRLSAHADRDELVKFIKSLKGVKDVVLVHGEQPQALVNALSNYNVHIPKNEEVIEISS